MKLILNDMEKAALNTMGDRHRSERQETELVMQSMIDALFEPLETRKQIARQYEEYRVRDLTQMMQRQKHELEEFVYERLMLRLLDQGMTPAEADNMAWDLIESREYLPAVPEDN